jgi:parvulin-like peptidyl-prolyl isomerase
MPKELKASDLYRQGRFNVANITTEPDGSTTITCDGVQAPQPYTFRARHFLTKDEEILEEDALEVES